MKSIGAHRKDGVVGPRVFRIIHERDGGKP